MALIQEADVISLYLYEIKALYFNIVQKYGTKNKSFKHQTKLNLLQYFFMLAAFLSP